MQKSLIQPGFKNENQLKTATMNSECFP